MTLHSVDAWEIECDQKGCFAFSPPCYSEALAADEGRLLGWVQESANQWLCPDHGLAK
jgi:hypothetical protein